MLAQERRDAILRIVKTPGTATVADFAGVDTAADPTTLDALLATPRLHEVDPPPLQRATGTA